MPGVKIRYPVKQGYIGWLTERQLMKTKILKSLVILVGMVALVSGCSTSNQGGASDATQFGAGSPNTGAGGSQSRSNPLGLDTGTGMTPAR
jgi:hypothetical protein